MDNQTRIRFLIEQEIIEPRIVQKQFEYWNGQALETNSYQFKKYSYETEKKKK